MAGVGDAETKKKRDEKRDAYPLKNAVSVSQETSRNLARTASARRNIKKTFFQPCTMPLHQRLRHSENISLL